MSITQTEVRPHLVRLVVATGKAGPQGPQGIPGEPGPAVAEGGITQVDADARYARLARTPDPTTGDLGLPGFAGSDTGWRDVSSLLTNGWVALTRPARLRRTGNVVHFTGYLDGRNVTNQDVYDLPTGFQATPLGVYANAIAPRYAIHGEDIAMVMVDAAQRIEVFERSNPQGHDLTNLQVGITWTTTDGWPSTLPGTEDTPPATWS